MLSNKFKKLFSKGVNEIMKDSIDEKNFHDRIQQDIMDSKKRMDENRKNFRLIRNK